jgi:hypothetical protein
VTVSLAPEFLSFAKADRRLDGVLSASFEGDYRTVALFDGDLVVDGDFLEALARIAGLARVDIIAVSGHLTVAGPIALYEPTPGLYVGGDTRAETLEGGDAEIYIQDGTFTYLVYGHYNDGILETGTVATPWVINSDHDLRVEAPGAYLVDNFGDDADADFGGGNIVESFVADVVDAKKR